MIPTLEAIQKMILFHIFITIVTPGKFKSWFQLNSISPQKFAFFGKLKILRQYDSDNMTEEASIGFKRYAIVDATKIRDSTNVCKKVRGLDATSYFYEQ